MSHAPRTDSPAWDPTPVFDTFWYFAAERQRVYMQRLRGCPAPWSDDPVLRTYRFTNVYRAADRVSQTLISEVIYDGQDRAAVDVVFRVLLFKIFNLESTWLALSEAFGDIDTATFDPAAFATVLDDLMAAGRSVYSAAYIVPPVPAAASRRKHAGHLELLRELRDTGAIERILHAQSLAELFSALRGIPGIGPFLAYQFATDLNYTACFDFDENEFVVAGPGARDGIAKCFGHSHQRTPEQIIWDVWRMQTEAFDDRGLDFHDLWGRPLSLIDVQNVFCEISKYARVAHPEVIGTSGRTRIKRTFAPQASIPMPVFPPKWKLRVEVPD